MTASTTELPAPVSPRRQRWQAARRGWPKSYPLVEIPNVPFVVFSVAFLVAMLTTGGVHNTAQIIARVFLAVWGYLELRSGVNAFKRMLGGAALAYVLYAVGVADGTVG